MFTWLRTNFGFKRNLSVPEIYTDKYDCIIIGGGTGGCMTAYALAKHIDERLPDNNVKVLLIDSGGEYVIKKTKTTKTNNTRTQSPSPDLWNWYNNWSEFTVVHETVASDFIPAIASTHIGIGGAGTHDTRITYIPREAQIERYAKSLHQSVSLFRNYIQSTLNMIPLCSAGSNEIFYDNVISKLNENNVLKAIPNTQGEIIDNSVSYVSLAMYPDRTRWTTAYLLDEALKPQSLDVIINTPVDKVLFDRPRNSKVYRAIGVKTAAGDIIHCKDDGEIIITAGSLGTPAILQRSGIGPKKILDALNIPVIHINDEVGHGVDHIEAPVMYRWLNKWNEPNGLPPPGGPMAWPLAMFLNNDNMVHFGISPPPYNGNDINVTATPNCMHPDPKFGFYAEIQTRNPLVPIHVRHVAAPNDFKVLASGVKKMINVFETMKTLGLVGDRVEPPQNLDLDDDIALDSWIRNHTGSAYHWMSTCKAGINGDVANHDFLVHGVNNLRVGSGAALPEIPEANPHFTITVFSIILADYIFKDLYLKSLIKRLNLPPYMLRGKDIDNIQTITHRFAYSAISLNDSCSWKTVQPRQEIPYVGSIMESHVKSLQ